MDLAVIVTDKEMELVQELWRKNIGMADIDLMLEEQSIRSSLWQDCSTDSEILNRLVFVGISNPKTDFLVCSREIRGLK